MISPVMLFRCAKKLLSNMSVACKTARSSSRIGDYLVIFCHSRSGTKHSRPSRSFCFKYSKDLYVCRKFPKPSLNPLHRFRGIQL